MSDKSSKEVLSEARPVIIWGDPEQEAFDLLTGNGYDSHQAKEHIDQFKKERSHHIRHQGIIDLLKGVGLLLIGVIPGIVLLYMYYAGFSIPSAAFLLCLMAVLFGLWKCIKGAERMILGGQICGSLTEIE